MKFNCGESPEKKHQRKVSQWHIRNEPFTKWHLWFAWKPVRVSDYQCVWLEWVERKGYVWSHRMIGWDYWEYKLTERTLRVR